MARIAVVGCYTVSESLTVLLELLTALLEYLDLFLTQKCTVFLNLNYNNNYECGRQSGMRVGDRKQGINKCWRNDYIIYTLYI